MRTTSLSACGLMPMSAWLMPRSISLMSARSQGLTTMSRASATTMFATWFSGVGTP